MGENGMTIVVYRARIATTLVVLWIGRKPTKRTFEMICFYFAGRVENEEMIQHLERCAPAQRTN